MSGEGGSGYHAGALQGAFNAAPFVPKAAPPAAAAAAPTSAAGASPAAGSGKGGKQAGSKLTLSAAPFVPGAGAAPQQASVPAPRPSPSKGASQRAGAAAPTAAVAAPADKGAGTPSTSASAGTSAAAGASQPGSKMSAAASSFVPNNRADSPADGTKQQGTPNKPSLRSPGKGRSGPTTPGNARGGRGRGRGANNSSGVGPPGLPPGPPPGLDPSTMRLGSGSYAGMGNGPGSRRSSPLPYGGYGPSHPSQLYQAGRGKVALASQFMTAGLRQQLQQCNYLEQAKWAPGQEDHPLPEKLHIYHTLYPLEDFADSSEASGLVLGVRSTCIKGMSAHDGRAYVLRHIDGKQVIPTSEMLAAARHAVESWEQLVTHPGLSTPRAAFVTSELDGSAALVFVHDFYPGAYTLAQAHLAPTQTPSGQLVANTPSEELLWSYLVQLASAVRAVHAAGLAVRAPCLHPSKVLLLPTGRLRIGSLGVLDALTGQPAGQEEVASVQLDDLVALGQTILTLASSVAGPAAAMMPGLEFVAGHYSPELVRVLAMLLGAADQQRAGNGGSAGAGGAFSWRHLWALLGEHTMVELDTLGAFNAQLMHDLARESENGRLLRLLVKLGFTNERPEGDLMAQWSETGDRYLIKLFRDHVFHQSTDAGQPRLDWGHVVEALNKLDAGVEEQVLLLSRDETSLLVVSYADIKRCVEAAYAELKAQAAPTMGGRTSRV